MRVSRTSHSFFGTDRMCTIIACRQLPDPSHRIRTASGRPTCSPSVTMTSYRCRRRHAYHARSGPAPARASSPEATALVPGPSHVDDVGLEMLGQDPIVGAWSPSGGDVVVERRRDGPRHRQQDTTVLDSGSPHVVVGRPARSLHGRHGSESPGLAVRPRPARFITKSSTFGPWCPMTTS
jgi:hypothetical protein